MKRSTDPFIIRHGADSFKESKIEGGRRYNEVSGSFLIGEGHSLWLGKLVTIKKARLLLIFLLLIFIALGGRLSYLQFVKGSEFRVLAEGNRLRLEQVLPARGIIFD